MVFGDELQEHIPPRLDSRVRELPADAAQPAYARHM